MEPCFKQVGKGKLGKKIEFVLREGILCRMSSEVPQAHIDMIPGDMQIVVPTQLRNHILKMAHDIQISGHEGMDRTLKRITAHFFWPGIVAETRKFVSSCPICQKVAG